MVVSYDGTFNGLLKLIQFCYKNNIIPDFVLKKERKNSILIDLSEIEFTKKFIHDNSVFLPFLSEIRNIESLIIKYVITKNIFLEKTLRKISKDVLNEFEKIKRKLYFLEYNGVFISSFFSNSNIIDLLFLYFLERLKNEKFIIYDEKRKIIITYNNKTKKVLKENKVNLFVQSYDPALHLWNIYQKSITI
ncbi:hypothetical protein HNP65_001837 [Thermosipho japonicus]|uniref:DUF4130 domain-containing protein n=1 Tax=Thermosipho japonicus TaxID=90323 RepID=A0A841GLV0_9BACT|nr:DUF4130 domain-containing protein [Thermosipho japonicus]MBB6063367.1 hypothetical protein [Thermosipho japonicus]